MRTPLNGRRIMDTTDLHRRVGRWVISMFGHDVLIDRKERAARVLEEAIELAQAEGLDYLHCAKQLNATYARPVGNPNQEAAGVMFCLMAWGYASCRDVLTLLDEELWDAERPERMAEIKTKVAAKRAAGLTTAQ
jgi:hypothetical protein